MFEDLKLKIGYSEMYELAEVPSDINAVLGRFVQFSKTIPGKIELATEQKSIIGVTTINSTYISDNTPHWWAKNVFNEVGDLFVQNKTIALGKKVYNSIIEKSYIVTAKADIIVPVQNPAFDETIQYKQRADRLEWVRVNLIGKVIVYDDGSLKPGEYCKLYSGRKDESKGKAIKATIKDIENSSINTYYVIARVSKNTILILFK